MLTHWHWVTHICTGNPGHSLIQIMACCHSAPSHYLNHCWNIRIVNLTFGNQLQWNFNQNLNIFIQENAIENVVCEIAAILSGPQCVNWLHMPLFSMRVNFNKLCHFREEKSYGIEIRNNVSKWLTKCLTPSPRTKWPLFHWRYFQMLFRVKSFVSGLRFNWSLFLRVQLTVTQYWLR